MADWTVLHKVLEGVGVVAFAVTGSGKSVVCSYIDTTMIVCCSCETCILLYVENLCFVSLVQQAYFGATTKQDQAATASFGSR